MTVITGNEWTPAATRPGNEWTFRRGNEWTFRDGNEWTRHARR